MGSENKALQSLNTPQPRVEDLSAEKSDDGNLEEINKQIEEAENRISRILECLTPEDENDEYQDDQLDSLIADARKRLEIGGVPIITPSVVIKEAERMLKHRLHAIIDDSTAYDTKRHPDPDLARRVRLALVIERDYYVGGKYQPPVEEGSFSDLFYRVARWRGEALSEKEVDILVRAGFGGNLAREVGLFNLGRREMPPFIPESLFYFCLTRLNFSSQDIRNVLQDAVNEGRKYSQQIFNLILNSQSYFLCLELFEAFEGGDLFKAIKIYSMKSSYSSSKQLLEKVEKLGLDNQEVVEAIIKNNWITLPYYGEKDTLRKYSFLAETSSTAVNLKTSFRESDPEIPQAARQLVESGNLGFLRGRESYLEWFLKHEYDWLLAQAEKHGQEHLLLSRMKPETQIAYVERLISEKKAPELVVLFGERYENSDKFEDHLFDENTYARLAEIIPPSYIPLREFKNLPPQVFRDTILDYPTYDRDRQAFLLAESFNFEGEGFSLEKEYQEYIKELKTFHKADLPAMGEESPIYFSKFSTLTPEDRSKWMTTFKLLDRMFYERHQNAILHQAIVRILTGVPYGSHLLFDLLENNTDGALDYMQGLYDLGQALIKGSQYDDYQNILPVFKCQIPPGEMGNRVKVISEAKRFLSDTGISESNSLTYLRMIAETENSSDAAVAWDEVKNLVTEVSEHEENFKLFYLQTFLKSGASEEERKKKLEELEKSARKLSRNEPIAETGGDYRIICEMVYPRRNYNSYQYLEHYQDRSADLGEYQFNPAGYKISLNGISEYRMRTGAQANPEILQRYGSRIQRIERWASYQGLENLFASSEFKSQTLEGKLLEFIADKPDDMIADVLLAYQMRDEYQAFIQDTRDQVGLETSEIEKQYIMLHSLAESFGDRLKETIKDTYQKVMESQDRSLFAGNPEHSVDKEDILNLGNKIVSDLGRIPREKLTEEIIRKKIATTLKTRFQKIPEIADAAVRIASDVNVESLERIPDEIYLHLIELFKNLPISPIGGQRMEAIQQKIYQEIQSELEKYEEVIEIENTPASTGKGEKKSVKRRSIQGYFSKNKENANARMVADVCIATDYHMLENPNYFEFVLFDNDRKKNIGTVMMLAMEEPNGKKYLLFCPNPSIDITSRVSADKLYAWIKERMVEFAEQNGFSGVLIDTVHGRGTNRPGKFQEAHQKAVRRSKKGQEHRVNLKSAHTLGGSYVYKDNLGVVWER